MSYFIGQPMSDNFCIFLANAFAHGLSIMSLTLYSKRGQGKTD